MADGPRKALPAADAEAALEAQIDGILMDSFPASDPPQWDSLAAGKFLRPDRDELAASARRQ